MYPEGHSGSPGEDDAVDYIVMAYADQDGVSRAQLVGQAFCSLSVEEGAITGSPDPSRRGMRRR